MTEPAIQVKHPIFGLPKFLQDWPSWCAWAAPTKRPLDLRRGLKGASTTDADTWASYSKAQDYLQTNPQIATRTPMLNGVGILIARPLVFIDFDDLLDSNGNAPNWAIEFTQECARLGAFVERSASGTGAHVILRTSPKYQHASRCRYTRSHPTSTPVGIEVYNKERFAALTGVLLFPDMPPHPNLNDPVQGDGLVLRFLESLKAFGAPIQSPDLPPTPVQVAPPTPKIQSIVKDIIERDPQLTQAFDDPAHAYKTWAQRRLQSNLDSSLSAWRYNLFLSACRGSPVSPLPVYELFNPQNPPVHPGIPTWQEFSGHLKKPHRKYADIQRAHAMVQDEMRLLAMDLEQEAPPPKPKEPPESQQENDPSWAALGLVMRQTDKGVRPLETSVNIIRLITRHPNFKNFKIERNMLNGNTMVNRETIKDSQITRWQEPLRAALASKTDPSAQSIRDAVEVIADDNPWDPITSYLDSLPPFDPATQPALLSGWLVRVGAKPSTDTEKFSRRILLGLVARAYKPGEKFDYVPVFEGEQGIRKSTLIKAIVSAPLYATFTGSFQDKDAKMILVGRWGVEISELAGFRRTDNETLKAFFATDTDSFRRPYGRAVEDIKRRVVMFGSTNDKQYLTDHTGARRYWPIYFPGEIDIEWFLANRDRLFAEAVYYYRKGETFHDTMKETKERSGVLMSRMVVTAWQARVHTHLSKLPKPSLPEGDDNPAEKHLGFSGALNSTYISDLAQPLNLPNAVQHMSPAQLVFFFKQAGFLRDSISYRTSKGSTKLNLWLHPALFELPDHQKKAFLSFFPELFHEGAPPSWELLRDEHLAAAITGIENGPNLPPFLDSPAEME